MGNPIRVSLTGGQAHDIVKSEELVAGLAPEAVLGDKAYDTDNFIRFLSDNDIEIVIPPKANRKEQREYDSFRYRERHLVECFFNKIKHFRRVFSRFDKLAKRYMAFVHFVSALIWLR